MKRELLLNFFNKIWTNIRQSPLVGILNGIVSILFLPFTLVGMMFKVLISRKIEKIQKEHQGQTNSNPTNLNSEYTEFEELPLPDDKTKKERITLEDWNIERWERKK